MDTKSPVNSQFCLHCGFANEDKRVFCQSCGKRLAETPSSAGTERAKLFIPPVTPTAPAKGSGKPAKIASSAQAREKRLRRESLQDRPPMTFSHFVMATCKIVVLSFLLAVIIQIIRPPENLPEAVAVPDKNAATLLHERLREDAENGSNRKTLTIKKQDINNYLASRIISSEARGVGKLLRCYFVPEENNCFRFGSENSILKIRVFIEAHCSIEQKEHGGYGIFLRGISIGRLNFPEFMCPYLANSFEGILGALTGPRSWFARAENLKIDYEAEGISAVWLKKR